MTERKKRPEGTFKKFLKENQKTLKQFQGNKADKYIRDPWMMRASPPVDKDEEILRKEEESF